MKGLLTVLLIASVLLNLFLLAFEKAPVEKIVKEIPAEEMKQIRELAVICGKNPDKANRMSAMEMLSDIRMFMSNAEPHYVPVLEKKELDIVRGFLITEKAELKIVEAQNKYLADMKGKKIIILPENEQ